MIAAIARRSRRAPRTGVSPCATRTGHVGSSPARPRTVRWSIVASGATFSASSARRQGSSRSSRDNRNGGPAAMEGGGGAGTVTLAHSSSPHSVPPARAPSCPAATGVVTTAGVVGGRGQTAGRIAAPSAPHEGAAARAAPRGARRPRCTCPARSAHERTHHRADDPIQCDDAQRPEQPGVAGSRARRLCAGGEERGGDGAGEADEPQRQSRTLE